MHRVGSPLFQCLFLFVLGYGRLWMTRVRSRGSPEVWGDGCCAGSVMAITLLLDWYIAEDFQWIVCDLRATYTHFSIEAKHLRFPFLPYHAPTPLICRVHFDITSVTASHSPRQQMDRVAVVIILYRLKGCSPCSYIKYTGCSNRCSHPPWWQLVAGN